MAIVVLPAARWQCARCGSTERRPAAKGCAECHRTREQARRQAARGEVRVKDAITPEIRAYLAAFDRYLLAAKNGDTGAARAAETERHEALTRL